MLGIGKSSNQVFLVNFGLARLFRDLATHIAQLNGSNVIGTLRYSSIGRHLRHAPSRRDDLESLAYVIIYLVKGSLPWQGIKVQPGQIYNDEVLRVKKATTAKVLCNGLPQPFVEFVNHIRSLGVRDKPDYKRLRGILEKCADSPNS